jgi:hypothetical protein
MTITRHSTVTKIIPGPLPAAIRRRGWSAAPVARSAGSRAPGGRTRTSRGPSCPPTALALSATVPAGTTAIRWPSRWVQAAIRNPTNQTGHQ